MIGFFEESAGPAVEAGPHRRLHGYGAFLARGRAPGEAGIVRPPSSASSSPGTTPVLGHLPAAHARTLAPSPSFQMIGYEEINWGPAGGGGDIITLPVNP